MFRTDDTGVYILPLIPYMVGHYEISQHFQCAYAILGLLGGLNEIIYLRASCSAWYGLIRV